MTSHESSNGEGLLCLTALRRAGEVAMGILTDDMKRVVSEQGLGCHTLNPRLRGS